MSNQKHEFLKKTCLNRRVWCWLWMYINHHREAGHLGEFNSSGMKELISQEINSIHAEELLLQKKASFLAPSSYTWIGNDKVQLNFILREISKNIYLKGFIREPNFINRDYIIALFDLLYSDTFFFTDGEQSGYIKNRKIKKQLKVDDIRKEWAIFYLGQSIFSWFDKPKKDPIKIRTGWHIFYKQHPSLIGSNTEFKSTRDILNIFNEFNLNFETRSRFLNEVKKRYSQNKWRAEKKVKKITGKTKVSRKEAGKSKGKIIPSKARARDIIPRPENHRKTDGIPKPDIFQDSQAETMRKTSESVWIKTQEEKCADNCTPCIGADPYGPI